MSLSEVISTALDHIQEIARTQTVIGEPIVAGKVTLVPVSRISMGFAAGGAGKEASGGNGAGTGGGVHVTPVAFIVVNENDVKVIPVEKVELDLGNWLTYAPGIIKKVRSFLNKDDKSGKKDKKKSDQVKDHKEKSNHEEA